MIHQFLLPEFPESSFEMQHSIWSSKMKLFKDGEPVIQSMEKGKPFLIAVAEGNTIEAYPKIALPDFIPTFEINGVKHQTARQLLWYEYLIGGLPMILMFVGGIIGGGIGGVGVVINYNIIRQEGSVVTKYLKLAGITVASYLLADALVYFLFKS